MNNRLFEHLCNDKNFVVRTAEELRCELEAEMQKESPDTDLINELVLAISEAENLPPVNIDIEKEYTKITINKNKKPVLRRFKVIAAAACAILALSNIYTYSAYGNNLYTLVTKKNHFITFKFLDSDKTDKNKFCYDDYGVKKFFEELGMKVEAPMYFPENFVITEKHPDEFTLTLSDGTGEVGIAFYNKKLPALSIQGISPDSSIILINEHDANYVQDENADWLVYKFDDIVAVYFFANLSDKEINTIIDSIK